MPKKADSYTILTTGEFLTKTLPTVKVRVEHQSQGFNFDTTFVYEGYTVEDLVKDATRKHVIARGNAIRSLPSDEAVAAIASEPSTVNVENSAAAPVTKETKFAEGGKLLSEMDEDERREFLQAEMAKLNA